MPGTVKSAPEFVLHEVAVVKVKPGMNGEEVAPPTEGRACEAPRSRRASLPVMTLNGLPEETSMSGATVKPLASHFNVPSPRVARGDRKTALVTQRWR